VFGFDDDSVRFSNLTVNDQSVMPERKVRDDGVPGAFGLLHALALH
jgi:hypothetical protein